MPLNPVPSPRPSSDDPTLPAANDWLRAYTRHALSETPELRDTERQQVLTERHLVPALEALETLLRQLRAELDPILRDAHPTSGGKPYPLGQCLRITEAIQARLETPASKELSGLAAEGRAALDRFVAAGGLLRRAWGDLRGQYFQNAMIIGTLYVDVSNDTVVVTKPPVEILPFARAGFSRISDYAHYARIAGRYWGSRMLPNHLMPELAPYLPLVEVSVDGRLRLGPANRYMLGLTLAAGFAPSARALAGPPLPPSLFAGLTAALQDAPTPLAADPEDGREAALARCREELAGDEAGFHAALAAARAVNTRLGQLVAIPKVA